MESTRIAQVWTAWSALAVTGSVAAQESAPLSVPGATSQPSGSEGGTPLGEGQGAPQGGAGSMLIWLLPLGLIVVLMFTSGRAAKKEQAKKAELMSSLTKQDKVQTAGGIIGHIAEIHGDELVLKVDESTGTRIRIAKSAVQTVLKESAQRKNQDAGSEESQSAA